MPYFDVGNTNTIVFLWQSSKNKDEEDNSMKLYSEGWIRQKDYMHGHGQLMQHLNSTSNSPKWLALDQVYKLVKFEGATCKEDFQSRR